MKRIEKMANAYHNITFGDGAYDYEKPEILEAYAQGVRRGISMLKGEIEDGMDSVVLKVTFLLEELDEEE